MGHKLVFFHHAPSSIRDLVQSLALLGHDSFVYDSLRGVVDRVLEADADMVIVELSWPSGSGRDIAQLIRRDSRCNHIPLALWSSSPADGTSTVVALGAQGLIANTKSTTAVVADINELLTQRRPHLPIDEAARLESLRSLHVLDTPADPILDAVVAAASAMAGVPIALVSLVDAERQWFKARLGLDVTETPRDYAFCAHAIHNSQVFEVPDALGDPRFTDNPLVQGDPKIRFYAGAPLLGSDGQALGTLCVIDRVPKTLTASQRQCLAQLGRAVVLLLEQRRPLAPRPPAPTLPLLSSA